MSAPMSRPWQLDRDVRAFEARLPPQYRLDSGCDDGQGLVETDKAPKRPRVRYMPPLDAPLLSQVATMSGFLRKQADNEPGRWTKYYFVLKPTTYLYYYNTQHDTEPRGIIDTEFLRDVRFNADCVQRSVGGSANGFRVTGQLPPTFCDDEHGNQATQLRPVYLDAESRAQATAWMEAIRHHRFNLDRHNDYEDLLATMDAADAQLTKLTDHTSQLQAASQRILRKASEYLGKLRGVEMPVDAVTLSDSDSTSTKDALRSISMLLDEIFAEGERQRRLVEILRERESEHFQREAQLKGCEADLKIQTLRCQQRERELESMLSERRDHEQIYETGCANIASREREAAAREQALHALTKQRGREFELKMQEVQKRSMELANERKKETAACNAELAKQRKTLDKQQKALEKKQKLIDRQLQEKQTLKSGFVAAVCKSLPTTSPKKAMSTLTDSLDSSDGRDSEDDGARQSDHQAAVTLHSHLEQTDSLRAGKASATEDSSALDQHSGSDEDPSKAETSTGSAVQNALVAAPIVEEVRNDQEECLEARFTSGGLSSQSSSRSTELVDTLSLAEPHNSSSDATRATSTDAYPVSLPVDSDMVGRLPPEWTCKESTSYQGRLYYFNIFTGETRWDFPFDVLLDDRDHDGYDERLGSDRDVYHAGETSDPLVTTQNVTEEAEFMATTPMADTPSKPKALWRNKLIAKVVHFRTEDSTPPRSPIERPSQDKAERCEF